MDWTSSTKTGALNVCVYCLTKVAPVNASEERLDRSRDQCEEINADLVPSHCKLAHEGHARKKQIKCSDIFYIHAWKSGKNCKRKHEKGDDS